MNLLRSVWCGLRSFVTTATPVTIGACSPSAVRVDLARVSSTATGVPNIGQFVSHDLVTDDLEAAKRFSGGLFGWQFEDLPGDPVAHSVIRHLGAP